MLMPSAYFKLRCLFVILIFSPFVLILPPAHAAPLQQADDPTAQCAEGVNLFTSGKHVEALPLLEAGFTNRSTAYFVKLDQLGYCALFLGYIYDDMGRDSDALDAYDVALQASKDSGNRELEGTTLNNIGVMYDSQAQYTNALAYYKQALSVWQEIGNLTVVGKMLNNIGGVYRAKKQYVDALDYYEQALNMRQQAGDRVGEGTTLNNIGGIYNEWDQYNNALAHYEQALTIQREVGDKVGEGGTLNNIGRIYNQQGQSTEALKYYEQALSIVREVGDRVGEGVVLNNIGIVYQEQGNYTEALRQLQQALAIAREISNRLEEGTSLGNIGAHYEAQGQYGKALEYYHQALMIATELRDFLGETTMLNNIGVVYRQQGRYDEALQYYGQALVNAKNIRDQSEESTILNNLGMTYYSQGKYVTALEHYQQALVIGKEVGNPASVGRILSNIGMIYKDQRKYPQALDYYEQSLTAIREVGNRAYESVTLHNIGAIYDDLGEYDDALEQYEKALNIKREVGDLEGMSITLGNISLVYNHQGRYADALKFSEEAMLVLDAMRSTAGNESARTSFIAQHSLLYDATVELYFNQNQPKKAFFIAERGRARSFLDSMATGYVELSDNDIAMIYTQEQETYAARQSAQEKLANAKTQNPPDQVLISDLETQLAQAEKDHQAALDTISQRNSYLDQLIPGRSKVLDVPQAQALLDDQTTLLSFWVLDDQTLVFVLANKTFNTISLPISRIDLYAKIKAFRDFANTGEAYPENTVELYKVLVEPLKSYLSTPNLVIVPHGELHYLPFAALMNGKRYLMDDYSITYLPSVSAWLYIKQNAGRDNVNPLIVGNPATDQTELQPLPFAENEAQAIADLYQTTALLGKAATESTVRSQAGQAGVLHLAAHGSYNIANPLYSAIYLASDGQNDGLLETHEIYGLNLKQTDLVVLSACETQLGELSTGDELVGLTRAFFFAGTPSVISSLWSVDDKATQLLMEKFYIYWRGGMGKTEALRQAQTDVREQYPNPYYWAGFVLNGDGGKAIEVQPSEKAPASRTFPVCGGSLSPIALIVVGALLVKNRKRYLQTF